MKHSPEIQSGQYDQIHDPFESMLKVSLILIALSGVAAVTKKVCHQLFQATGTVASPDVEKAQKNTPH